MAKNLLITVSAVWLMACAGASSDSESPSNNSGGGGSSKSSRIKLPGACVDPMVDGDLHDQTRTFEEHVHIDVHAIDLDDDGDVDFFVVSPQCITSCTRSMYVARGSCGVYVGTFNSTSDFFAKDSKHESLKDLVIHPRRDEDGSQHCYEGRLEFNGKTYVEKARRECECKPPGEEAKCEAWPN